MYTINRIPSTWILQKRNKRPTKHYGWIDVWASLNLQCIWSSKCWSCRQLMSRATSMQFAERPWGACSKGVEHPLYPDFEESPSNPLGCKQNFRKSHTYIQVLPKQIPRVTRVTWNHLDSLILRWSGLTASTNQQFLGLSCERVKFAMSSWEWKTSMAQTRLPKKTPSGREKTKPLVFWCFFEPKP